MKKLLQFTSAEGNDFYIEVEDPAVAEASRGGTTEPVTRGIIQNVQESFDKALQPLKEISNSIVNCIKDIANSPEEVEVELGLKFTAKAGIILTSFDSEANLKIVLRWKKNSPSK
jgi:hypothetical protein